MDNDNAALKLLFGPALAILAMIVRANQTHPAKPTASIYPARREAVNSEPSQHKVSALDFSPVVEMLRRIHRTANGQQERVSRQNIHQPLQELETALRQHATAVDRLLGPLGSDKPSLYALQQTLFLQCPRGGKTAGRFRCINRTGTPARVDVRVRGIADADNNSVNEPNITVEPNDRLLEPLESGIFRATVDLSRCPSTVDKSLEIRADIYLNGELSLKLFICVELYEFRPLGEEEDNG